MNGREKWDEMVKKWRVEAKIFNYQLSIINYFVILPAV